MTVTSTESAGAPSPAVGRAAFRGSSWMIANALVSRVTGFAATILLGWWLTPGDFGVYGIAMSLAAVTAILREGGVRQYLIREHRRHDELIGPVYYMALSFNLLTALVLLAMAGATGVWTDDHHQAAAIATVLCVVALSAPLSTPGAILQARLMGDLAFGVVSAVNGLSALIRHGLSILLAWRFGGQLGALAIVLSLPVCAVFEWVAFARFNPERLWSRRPRVATWWSLLSHTRWILLGSLAIVLINSGPHVALSAVSRDTTLVGLFFMAYNIVIQVGVLLSANIGAVLMPAFAKLVDEPDRLGGAILKAIRQIMLVAAPISLGLAVSFPPLEHLFWHGKWEGAAAAVRVLGYTYPLSVLLSVPLAAQQGLGRFREWALGLVVIGAVTVAGTATGAALFQEHPDAAGRIAWCVGIPGAVASFAWSLVINHRCGIPARRTVASALPAWGIAMAVALPIVWIDGRWLSGFAALPRLVACAGLFVLGFLVLARIFVPGHLREALALAPARVAPLCRRALRLGEAS